MASLVSPPGVGGVAVVQVLGPAALETVLPFLRNLTNDKSPRLDANRLKLARWMEAEEHIDDVIVVRNACTSATPSICINTHGSIRVVERILMCLERAGASILRQLPVEEMWENVDPIEAAIMKHLPRAKTKHVGQWLMNQITALRHAVQECINLLEQKKNEFAAEQLRLMLESYHTGDMLLRGAQVVIVGPPNSGKSTLANRLFDKPWSIESEEAGTTRDWVQHAIAVSGVPLMLADTAGLRQTDDELETLAIQNAHLIIRNADVQILVLDSSLPGVRIEQAWLKHLLHKDKLIIVLNKSDLGKCRSRPSDGLKSCQSAELPISALRNEGLDELRSAILKTLNLENGKLPACCIWDPDQKVSLKKILSMVRESPDHAAQLLRLDFFTLQDENLGNFGPIVQ